MAVVVTEAAAPEVVEKEGCMAAVAAGVGCWMVSMAEAAGAAALVAARQAEAKVAVAGSEAVALVGVEMVGVVLGLGALAVLAAENMEEVVKAVAATVG